MGNLHTLMLDQLSAEAEPVVDALLFHARQSARASQRGKHGLAERHLTQAARQARQLHCLLYRWEPLGFRLEDLPQVRDAPGRLRLVRAAYELFASPEGDQAALRRFRWAALEVGG